MDEEAVQEVRVAVLGEEGDRILVRDDGPGFGVWFHRARARLLGRKPSFPHSEKVISRRANQKDESPSCRRSGEDRLLH